MQVCPNLDPLGVDLLKQILVYDPKKRITARKALQHPYFEASIILFHQSKGASLMAHGSKSNC